MAQILIRARDNDPWFKGTPVDTMDKPDYAGMVLPEFVWLNVTDATLAQLEQYLDQWKTDYKATEGAVDTTRRITVAPNQGASAALIVDSPVSFGVVATGQYFERGRDNDLSTADADVDLANTVASVDNELIDKYDDLLQVRHWSVDTAFVDTVIGEGGRRDMTLAELQAVAVDAYG